jgi:hypothetical protein
MATERLSMRKLREILRLKWTLACSHRDVAASLQVGLGTVTAVLRRATLAGLDWAEVQPLTDDALEARLYGVARPGGRGRPVPEWAWIHAERKQPGVTLELLHLEVPRATPRGLLLHPLLRPVPGVARPPPPVDAPGAPGGREGLRRLRRAAAPERFLEPWVADLQAHPAGAPLDRSDQDPAASMPWSDRIDFGLLSVRETLAGVWHYLVGGIAIGAMIYGYIPVAFVSQYMGKDTWWNVPVAVLLGLPLYASAVGVIPIVQAVLAKGAAVGTTLAFMMSVIGISIPELVMLRKVIRMPLIWAFVGFVALGIVLVGYIFNALM